MITEQLVEVLESAPDVYEDFASCTARMVVDLDMVDAFWKYHKEHPRATTDEILGFLFDAADLKSLTIISRDH